MSNFKSILKAYDNLKELDNEEYIRLIMECLLKMFSDEEKGDFSIVDYKELIKSEHGAFLSAGYVLGVGYDMSQIEDLKQSLEDLSDDELCKLIEENI